MQQNEFDVQRPADQMPGAQADFAEQSLPPARWDHWTAILTLSGEPTPVTVLRPVEWRPVSELPDELQKKICRQQTDAGFGVGCLCYMLPTFAAMYLWSRKVIRGDFLDFLLIVGIAGTVLFLLFKLLLIDRAASAPEVAASYVWFYGQVDDLVIGSRMLCSLSVNGYEIPLQLIPPGVTVINMSSFTDDSYWLRNTDIIVVQKDNSEGVKTPNLLIFPAQNNRLINNRIVVIRR